MPVSIRIDENSDIAIVECSGSFGSVESKKAVEQLWGFPGWSGRMVIWDFRSASFDLSGADIQQMAVFVLDHQREEPPARVSWVVARDLDFGMSRMFEVFRSDPRTAFRVFRDWDEALAWTEQSGDPTG